MGTCALNQSFDAEALYRGYCKKGSNIWDWVKISECQYLDLRFRSWVEIKIKSKASAWGQIVSPSASYLEKHPK